MALMTPEDMYRDQQSYDSREKMSGLSNLGKSIKARSAERNDAFMNKIAPMKNNVTSAVNNFLENRDIDEANELQASRQKEREDAITAREAIGSGSEGANVTEIPVALGDGTVGTASVKDNHAGGGINPRLVELTGPTMKQYGLKVSSGYRPNSKLKTSQHVHGNAYDIPWGTTDVQKRRNIIKSFQNAGLTGFGVGHNILHVDVGKKRHWTYNKGGDWVFGMMPGYEDLFR